MTKKFVAILMGSDSDLPVMNAAVDILKSFDVAVEVKVTSAHRTPSETQSYVKDAEARGCQAFIAGAGMAAHLAGAVAAQTTRPVIGVPIDAGPLQGFDALLSTVQMPGGIPVATVAIGKAGAKNAGYLAIQMMALSDDALQAALVEERANNARAIVEKADAIAKQYL
ncbi:MAG: 5-(carboxyamino)imidazole ribonucleotide mutase [Pseudomonadales bacterium]|jgi:5-(carboxyamino)imidazole ribonucleotide mutase|nr:5-(carboxyamino)imidazole ribonucleotide mutase [Pseudomonadales bacterium]MDA0760102.1 5-(carboxyamino)imidazole ribonucleotide mutase [Pseudomonadota bacterium]MDA0957877.1 5-(carboxyamino)imidazole ribonucleotide mutase [Pseudomonadota bacterium]MDA1206862.1 5-(carboxyamino)imidazole ribonucleotide mutase [Pseudomonadota bacterium]